MRANQRNPGDEKDRAVEIDDLRNLRVEYVQIERLGDPNRNQRWAYHSGELSGLHCRAFFIRCTPTTLRNANSLTSALTGHAGFGCNGFMGVLRSPHEATCPSIASRTLTRAHQCHPLQRYPQISF